MKSVSVTVYMKDKDNVGAYICILLLCMPYTATETENPPERATVGIRCNLLAAPPLQKLTSSVPQSSLDDYSLWKRQIQIWKHLLRVVSKVIQLSKCTYMYINILFK